LCLLYENPIKLPSKGDSSLNGPRHSLMLGANHSLCVIGVGFQLYGQLKKSPHDSTGVLGSTAVLTASQATRLSKGSSVTVRDERVPYGSYYSEGSLEWILKTVLFFLDFYLICFGCSLDIHCKGTPPSQPLNSMTTLRSYSSLFTSDT